MSDSDTSDASPFGWALRVNGSCLDVEEDCGMTIEPYRVCCPGGSYCPHAYNVACCPSGSNCTEALEAKPHCANETWDLYINGGYFCCEHGTIGYATDTDSNGCGDADYELQVGESALPIIQTGTVTTSTPSPTSTPSTTATDDSSSSTPTSTSNSSSSSSDPNTGAIAGGVVGGVCGAAIIAVLVWLLIRTRRRQQTQDAMNQAEYFNKAGLMPPESVQTSPLPVEMDAHRFAELGDHRTVAELPGYYGR
ncbi:hypothetical protein ASPVEDRAFT_79985 [Aspergillus versicolor CBS 583.65]|uniref:Mid2 domain-containing protein n=1 Tax=Aspergillus versicolor CBS 583.65 TaxID=1036611 RepID=A0A1L9PA44_ASPVE|nr:uncharacterized protein ASPVEDRAFT_79985 [Aspergillus versicolor CBS 583.65]OJI98324.1 hypothetical protein ASPVEDRAFT_79985 [Aspergillus versicolor CBS 583.65]